MTSKKPQKGEDSAGPGDEVTVEYEGVKMEGRMMTSTEANGEFISVVKLKNGYNIGFDSRKAKVRKVSDAPKKEGCGGACGLQAQP